MGAYAYAGQYQQRPSPAQGGIIKRNWWQYYQQTPPRFDIVVESWDCAFKATAQADFVVGQVWGKVGANLYLLDQVRGRFSFTETQDAIRNLSAKWPQAHAKLVEDKANGPAVIDSMRNAVPGLIPVDPQGGKVVRAQAVSVDIEAGNVWLPDPTVNPWITDFVEECAAFPNGAHDDQVDAMTQAIVYLGKEAGGVPCPMAFGSDMSEPDGQDLWEKVYAGIPLTESEIDRLPEKVDNFC